MTHSTRRKETRVRDIPDSRGQRGGDHDPNYGIEVPRANSGRRAVGTGRHRDKRATPIPQERGVSWSRRWRERTVSTIVARVQPRTSEGITDLLLPTLDSPLPSALSTLGIYPAQGGTSSVTFCAPVASISFVDGIDQTNHSTNQQRPCTTTH